MSLSTVLSVHNFYQQPGGEDRVFADEAALLERQLIKRFGPLPAEIQQRLAEADTGQLEFWAERVLDATTLDLIFDLH